MHKSDPFWPRVGWKQYQTQMELSGPPLTRLADFGHHDQDSGQTFPVINSGTGSKL
jgi:hypothetical protein